MPFTLRLLFSGLCAFVPKEDDNNQLAMYALLIDARSPGLARGNSNYKHVSHVPAVRFKTDPTSYREDESSLPPDKFFLHPGSSPNDLEGMWVLDKDDLVLQINTVPVPTENIPQGGGLVDAGGNRSFIAHAQKTSDIYNTNIGDLSNGLDVNAALLTGSIISPLVARVGFSNGTIGVYNGDTYRPLDDTGQRVPYIYRGSGGAPGVRFSNSNDVAKPVNPHKQDLQTCVFVEFSVPDIRTPSGSNLPGKFVIGAGGKFVTFSASNGSEVEVMIENGPPLGIVGANQSTDYDFELVYEVAKQKPSVLRVPHFPAFPPTRVCGFVVYNPV